MDIPCHLFDIVLAKRFLENNRNIFWGHLHWSGALSSCENDRWGRAALWVRWIFWFSFFSKCSQQICDGLKKWFTASWWGKKSKTIILITINNSSFARKNIKLLNLFQDTQKYVFRVSVRRSAHQRLAAENVLVWDQRCKTFITSDVTTQQRQDCVYSHNNLNVSFHSELGIWQKYKH